MIRNDSCKHPNVICLNPYEIIRKYQCIDCSAVMMCDCEEEFATEYYPHQLDQARSLETGLHVPVTHGFQKGVCNTCRGLPDEPHPKAEIYGESSKIKRYYWREITFETTKAFGKWAKEQGYDDWLKALFDHREKHQEFRRAAIEQIKQLHEVSPKYVYQDIPQIEVIKQFSVKVVELKAEHCKGPERRILLKSPGGLLLPEDFVIEHYKTKGLSAIKCESSPFHVLFGVLCWLLIQDYTDPLIRRVGFGDRDNFEAGKEPAEIWTSLPPDFGTSGYAKRRSIALEEHFELLNDDLHWLFDYWLDYSHDFRQYLWAHRENDIETAKILLEVLPHSTIRRILRYLAENYWDRYTGWPDLLVYNDSRFLFAEVKASGDRLREDQKKWIKDNAEILKLPFELVRIHRIPNP